MTYAGNPGTQLPGAPSPLAPLVDHTRQGSPAGQALTGVVGIVLAIVLVLGQVSLATTKGIAAHLHQSVEHITEGNQVMESVIERAAPVSALAEVVEGQAATLARTRDAMVRVNGETGAIIETTGELDGVVARMESTSGMLATNVDGMNQQTTRITDLLGGLPAATGRTHDALVRINADTVAINGELGAIGGKMERYGLPHAQGVRTR